LKTELAGPTTTREAQMISSSSSGTWLGKTLNHLLPGSLHTKTPNTRRLENVTELGPKSVSKMQKNMPKKRKKQQTPKYMDTGWKFKAG
jgi:hypothetical protein